MLKTAPTSRIHLIAAARGGGKAADPAIRRFRLARVRVDGRAPEMPQSARAPRG